MRTAQLKHPFIAGAAALMMVGLMVSPHLFWRWNHRGEQLLAGLIVVAVASVTIYSVIRAIVARPER
jgi:hypothetical protein